MIQDKYTLPANVSGLEAAIFTTLSLRRAGFKTWLRTPSIAGHEVIQVIATPPSRPPRSVRCGGNSR